MGEGVSRAAQNFRLCLSEVQTTQLPVLGLLGCPPRLEAEKGFTGVAEQRETVRGGNIPGQETAVQSSRAEGSQSGPRVPKLLPL